MAGSLASEEINRAIVVGFDYLRRGNGLFGPVLGVRFAPIEPGSGFHCETVDLRQRVIQ